MNTTQPQNPLEAASLIISNALTRHQLTPDVKEKIDTVREAVKTAYNQLPETFISAYLCQKVRKLMNSKTMDGTILRRLRELRESGECPYEVIDNFQSIYKKV